ASYTGERRPTRRAWMLKKIGAVAFLAALVSVVVSTTAWGSAKAPRTAAAATKTVKCGTRVSIGVAYPGAGLAPVSGSATRVFLTRAKTGKPRETSKGFFYRTVPNDGQQGDAVANFINKDLKKKRIYIIDDEEAYSQGLADQVQADLKKVGINASRNHVAQNVSDFSSLIAAIPSN